MSIALKKLVFLTAAIKKVLPDVMVGQGLKIKHEFTLEELSARCEEYRDQAPIFVQSHPVIEPPPQPYQPIDPKTMPWHPNPFNPTMVTMYGCPSIPNGDVSYKSDSDLTNQNK